MVKQVICTLDTGNLDEAIRVVERLCKHVGSFKIGHALTLPHGIAVVDRLKEAGAERVFLDLKLHDYPDAVGRAVREAGRRGVWMLTLHISGGPAMMQAAVEEANQFSPEKRPQLIGVAVLGSVDEHTLGHHLGVQRTVEEHALYLSRLAIDYELDGVGCAPQQVAEVRAAIGHGGIIVCRGLRTQVADGSSLPNTTEATRLCRAANYILLGRALIDSSDPDATLATFGFQIPAASR